MSCRNRTYFRKALCKDINRTQSWSTTRRRDTRKEHNLKQLSSRKQGYRKSKSNSAELNIGTTRDDEPLVIKYFQCGNAVVLLLGELRQQYTEVRPGQYRNQHECPSAT